MIKKKMQKDNLEINFNKFNTINEFISYVKNGKKTKDWEDECSNNNNYSFSMTRTLEEAYELCQNGWDEGAKKISNKINECKNVQVSNKKNFQRYIDVVGFQAIVPNYLNGIPKQMMNSRLIIKKDKIVNLYKNLTYNANVSTDHMIDEGVKCLELVKDLENQGYRVNIFALFSSLGEQQKINRKILNLEVVKIKGSSERLNISKMAYFLAHPSFLRRISLRYSEISEDYPAKIFYPGYGQAFRDNNTVKEYLESLGEKNIMIM